MQFYRNFNQFITLSTITVVFIALLAAAYTTLTGEARSRPATPPAIPTPESAAPEADETCPMCGEQALAQLEVDNASKVTHDDMNEAEADQLLDKVAPAEEHEPGRPRLAHAQPCGCLAGCGCAGPGGASAR